ncbi:MAG: M48 family metallopeptidase [Hyphomicrobiales bacterium]
MHRLESSLYTTVAPAGAVDSPANAMPEDQVDIDTTPKADTAVTKPAVTSIGDKGEALDLSPETQEKLGKKLATEALARADRSSDKEMEQYLTLIVRKLAATLPADAPHFTYTVYLIDSHTPNAFTSGGGHIFVTTALVKRLTTEAQMAMVLAHELAHNVEGHVVKGYNGRDVTQRVAAFGKRVFEEEMGVPWVSQGISSLAKTGFSNFTRAQEEKADEEGLAIMAAAGYDPREAVKSFEALIQKPEVKSPFDIFRGYPPGLKRAEKVKDAVAETYGKRDLSHRTVSTTEYDTLWATLDSSAAN